MKRSRPHLTLRILETLIEKYVATVDPIGKDEWHMTHRALADGELNSFLEWLKTQLKKKRRNDRAAKRPA